jgi:hypothetical protein
MSLEVTLSRITELQSLLSAPAGPPAGPSTVAATAPGAVAAGATATAGAPAAFSSVLGQQSPTAAAPLTAAMPAAGGTNAGRAALAAARNEVGVTEQPPGSNDAPRIAQYRKSTAGSMVAPWCAYFVSWAAREAGAPLGDSGQGFGAVADVWSWAQRTGKAIPAGEGAPQPGDLIVWNGRHIGIVESVQADGSVHTIEGNSSDMVTRRVHRPDGDGATGYVRLG